MTDYGKLPFTGAGITLGAVVIDQLWLVAFGVALVAIGALMVRNWRREKSVTDR
jgi:LPXTG-motif cell wall-anchored protein